MNIKLKKNEFELLINSKFVSQNIKNFLNRAQQKGDQVYCVDMDENIIDELHENLVEQFQFSGVGADGEPTKEGLVIEELIDKFFT